MALSTLFSEVIFEYNARSTHSNNNLDQRCRESKYFLSKTLKKVGQIINYKLTDNIHTHLPLFLTLELRVNNAPSTSSDAKRSAGSPIIMRAPLRAGCREPSHSPYGGVLALTGFHPRASAFQAARSACS